MIIKNKRGKSYIEGTHLDLTSYDVVRDGSVSESPRGLEPRFLPNFIVQNSICKSQITWINEGSKLLKSIFTYPMILKNVYQRKDVQTPKNSIRKEIVSTDSNCRFLSFHIVGFIFKFKLPNDGGNLPAFWLRVLLNQSQRLHLARRSSLSSRSEFTRGCAAFHFSFNSLSSNL